VTGSNRDDEQTRREREQRLLLIGHACTSVAHDVNNCLQMMFYDIDLMESSLRRGALSSEQTESGLRSLGQSIDKASGICRRLLEFAKGGLLAQQKTDAKRVLLDCQPLFARLFRAPAEVEVKLPDASLWITLASTQLEQVVANLVLNAWQATGEQGHVRVELDELNQAGVPWVRLRVSDDGTGIPAEVLPRIFEPYFSTKPPECVGLGLSLVNDVVKSIHGEVQVTTQLGGGSCFTVLMPPASAS
jgi:two-component system, cell cycle sensor histidine kinase and response regulator CckA